MVSRYYLTSGILVSLLSLGSATVMAHDHQLLTAQAVKTIQQQQSASIKEGIRHGRLTPREAKKLKDQQQTIIAIEQTLSEDGVLDRDEIKVLFHMLEEARNNINTLLRNRITSHAVFDGA